jgi:type II secretory pathway pseudopilin PulG
MVLGILGILLSVVITVGVYMWAKDKGTQIQQQIQQEIEKEQQRQAETGSPTTVP